MTSHCNSVFLFVVLLTSRKGTCLPPWLLSSGINGTHHPRQLGTNSLHNLRAYLVLSFMTNSQHIN